MFSLRLPLAASFALLLAACTTTHTEAPKPATSSEHMEEEEVFLPQSDLANVMQSKVAYSAALLQAIAMQDYEQLERNTQALRRLSREASFITHDTVTYRALSDTFRQDLASLAEHARQRDQAAIEADYHRLTATCFRCHAYVREERFRGSLPGRVSMR